jgi:hypothetical protein
VARKVSSPSRKNGESENANWCLMTGDDTVAGI